MVHCQVTRTHRELDVRQCAAFQQGFDLDGALSAMKISSGGLPMRTFMFNLGTQSVRGISVGDNADALCREGVYACFNLQVAADEEGDDEAEEGTTPMKVLAFDECFVQALA